VREQGDDDELLADLTSQIEQMQMACAAASKSFEDAIAKKNEARRQLKRLRQELQAPEGGATDKRALQSSGTAVKPTVATATPTLSAEQRRALYLRSLLPPVTPWVSFRRRLRHSMLLLCSLLYLRVTVMQLSVFRCVEGPDPSFAAESAAAAAEAAAAGEGRAMLPPPPTVLLVAADMQTVCYVGQHLVLCVCAGVLFVTFILGFPLVAFRMLTRAFATADTKGFVGFLRRHFACMRAHKPHRALKAMAKQGIRRAEEAAAAAAAENEAGTATHVAVVAWAPPVKKGKKAKAKAAAASAASAVTAVPSLPELLSMAQLVEREETYGFLFLGVRNDCFTAPLQQYIWLFAYALVNVYAVQGDDGGSSNGSSTDNNGSNSGSSLSSDGSANEGTGSGTALVPLFLLGLVNALSTLSIAYNPPYTRFSKTLRHLLVGLASVGHAVLMAAVQRQASSSVFLYLLCTLMLLLAVALLLRLPVGARLLKRCKRKDGQAENSENEVKTLTSVPEHRNHVTAPPPLSSRVTSISPRQVAPWDASSPVAPPAAAATAAYLSSPTAGGGADSRVAWPFTPHEGEVELHAMRPRAAAPTHAPTE
jgi:hypothetical protein